MEKQTVFRKVSVKDRLPKDYGHYITDVGYIEYSPGHLDEWQYGSPYPSYWLEEIELPSDEFEPTKAEAGTSMWYYDKGFEAGVNYILNKLK